MKHALKLTVVALLLQVAIAQGQVYELFIEEKCVGFS